jgi:hypothetical protein
MSGKGAKAAPAKGKAAPAKGAAGKAVNAAKAARNGTTKRTSKVHYKAHFYRPTTLKLDRDPKYKRALPSARGTKFDKYRIVKKPLTTER